LQVTVGLATDWPIIPVLATLPQLNVPVPPAEDVPPGEAEDGVTTLPAEDEERAAATEDELG
jgi:hypothetical protein